MAAKPKTTRETAIRKLAELATAKVNDAVRLAFLEGDEEIGSLDLTALTEFKRGEKGLEIKLVDRAAIWRELAILTDESTDEKLRGFLRAMEE